MSIKLFYLVVSSVVLVLATYWGIENYQQNPDRLLARLIQQMKEERFEELYDESDGLVKKNVGKNEFVRRMRDAVGKLKEIDPHLNFQKNPFLDSLIKPHYLGMSTAVAKLENENYSVVLIASWQTNSLSTGFKDIVIQPGKNSSQFASYGITYKNISYEEGSGKKTIIYHY